VFSLFRETSLSNCRLNVWGQGVFFLKKSTLALNGSKVIGRWLNFPFIGLHKNMTTHFFPKISYWPQTFEQCVCLNEVYLYYPLAIVVLLVLSVNITLLYFVIIIIQLPKNNISARSIFNYCSIL